MLMQQIARIRDLRRGLSSPTVGDGSDGRMARR
jgi:hypothetical protein